VERVSQFSDERSRAIKLRVAEGELHIHSSLSETGESEESLPAEYLETPVEIGFNAGYLLDFLRATTESQVAFHFKDAHSAGELRPAGEAAANYKYRYVVMPMRI
jgi:DNA polymerase-3 subunit beta